LFWVLALLYGMNSILIIENHPVAFENYQFIKFWQVLMTFKEFLRTFK
jgi:hypothetical protein